MSTNSKIEWTDHTFNPWEGCQKVGPGCDNCYAEARNARFCGGQAVNWGPGTPRRRTSAANWALPLRWNAQHEAFMTQHGRRQRVFCASLADVFDNQVDPQWRADLFALILQTPNLDWLLLTKRIGNVKPLLAELAHGTDPDLSLLDMMPLPNVWLGATVVNQAEAERDIPKLLAVPAAKRFLSMEPLQGAVNISDVHDPSGGICLKPLVGLRWVPLGDGRVGCRPEQINRIDWVIVGGESGPGARPMHPDWAINLRDQCNAAAVPFLFKQWGEWMPINQMAESEHSALYVPQAKAKPHEDQAVIDDIYGKRCTVPSLAVHPDGSTHDILAPGTWTAGAMQTFKAGKKAAGRALDGRTWDEFPA